MTDSQIEEARRRLYAIIDEAQRDLDRKTSRTIAGCVLVWAWCLALCVWMSFR